MDDLAENFGSVQNSIEPIEGRAYDLELCILKVIVGKVHIF